MIQEEDLILLNIDTRCKGTYTWQRSRRTKKCNRPNIGKSMRIREISRNGNRGKKRNIWSPNPCMVRLSLKIKKNKQMKEKEETIEKYKLSQRRMNNYKKKSEG